MEAHLGGHVHVAWNSPLAWIQTARVAKARGLAASAVAGRHDNLRGLLAHLPCGLRRQALHRWVRGSRFPR